MTLQTQSTLKSGIKNNKNCTSEGQKVALRTKVFSSGTFIQYYCFATNQYTISHQTRIVNIGKMGNKLHFATELQKKKCNFALENQIRIN